MKNIGEKTFLFLIGYFLYSMLEIVWRGFTHWTMAITGGICLIIIYYIANSEGISIWKQAFMSAIMITIIEFIVGIIDNIVFRWNVWDYSSIPLNILGQICVPFTILWFLVCIPAILLCKQIKLQIFNDYIYYNTNEGNLSSIYNNNLDAIE